MFIRRTADSCRCVDTLTPMTGRYVWDCLGQKSIYGLKLKSSMNLNWQLFVPSHNALVTSSVLASSDVPCLPNA